MDILLKLRRESIFFLKFILKNLKTGIDNSDIILKYWDNASIKNQRLLLASFEGAKTLKHVLKSSDGDLVYCHTDLTPNNIMRENSTLKFFLIN